MDDEREVKAREKANRLISSFEGRKLPKSLRINVATFSPDLKKTVDASIIRLQHSKPYSAPFLTAFNHLFKIKKLLDNEPN